MWVSGIFTLFSLQTFLCRTAAIGIFRCLWLSGTGTVNGSWPWHAWLHWHPSQALLSALCSLRSWLSCANLSPQPHCCWPGRGLLWQFCGLVWDSSPQQSYDCYYYGLNFISGNCWDMWCPQTEAAHLKNIQQFVFKCLFVFPPCGSDVVRTVTCMFCNAVLLCFISHHHTINLFLM